MNICEAGRDSCGCDNWKKGIRTINGQYPDDNRDFDINAGAGVSITPATGGITVGLTAPLPGGMTFMGTVGTGGTIATLPNADVTNRGFCYVAISAGTTPDTTPKSYDIGDTLVSNGVEWIVIPSGNDPVDWSDILNKPTTLSGYGITDAVDISSAQDISGYKKMTGSFAVANTFSQLRFLQSADLSASDGMVMQEVNYDANNKTYVQVDRYRRGSATLTEEHTYLKGADGTNSDFSRYRYDNGVAWSQTPNRTYNPSNTSDIVNVAMLQASSDVVHRTGNESIAGIKTFSDGIYIGSVTNEQSSIYHEHTSTCERLAFEIINSDNDCRAYFQFNMYDNGTVGLEIIKNVNGVWSSTTVATL